MKIALTADPEIPVPPILYGGIERIVDLLAREMSALGHDITLFAHPESKVDCKLIGWKGRNSSSKIDSIINAGTLLQYVVKEKYDIIHSFSRMAYMIPIFPLKQPKIMSYQREPSLEQVARAAKLSKKGSLIFTGCSDYISLQIKSVTESVTVYNCVPIERYNFSESVDDDAPLVFLGRIEHIKGVHIAIDVARKSNRKLIIAGNIPIEGIEYFKEKIEPHLSGSITYVGPVDDRQKNELLGSAAAFLMPIQWNEPFGIVMAEAMACGTPVLGFPLGSVPEIIKDGVNGYICTDTLDMAAKIDLIRNINRKEVRRIAEQRFGDKVIVQEYANLYEKMKAFNRGK